MVRNVASNNVLTNLCLGLESIELCLDGNRNTPKIVKEGTCIEW
jgi:hypothetical protein